MKTDELVRLLASERKETEYVEFKTGFDPKVTGERISAIANSAALAGREFGYIVFGVHDSSFKFIGTDFDPDKEKYGNMPIKNWLEQMVEPKINIEFSECIIDEKRIVVLKVSAAPDRPVSFYGTEYIRVGEVTRPLKSFPEKEKKIWNSAKNRNFENEVIGEDFSQEEILGLLDYDKYFRLTKQKPSTETRYFIDRMQEDGLLKQQDDGRYKVTALGGLLFARNLSNFALIGRKAVRVIKYQGNSKSNILLTREGEVGYAIGFENLVDFISTQVPNNEEIEKALRIERSTYPLIAIREFVANALIHQDFSIEGAGPTIEIFENRIEITNPGKPLIDVDRFIDLPPQSRNQATASLMRRFGFCEELGSGVDRAVTQIEMFQLPAPKFETFDSFTRVTMFAPRAFKDMTQDDRIRACYQHAVLLWVSNRRMTNASLRERFGIGEKNYPAASKIIRATLDEGLIKESDKGKEYVPGWA